MSGPDAGAPPRLEIDRAGRATITLARPRQRNRLQRDDLLELQAHFEALARPGAARVLVLAAHGSSFCAGYNLDELGRDDQSAARDPRLFEQTVERLEALPLPSIARLHAGLYGGATDLALACDLRIGTPATELRMPAARLGLHFYASGLRRFVTRLGLGPAKRMFLLGQTWSAEQLLAAGYLDELVPAEALDARIDALAAELAANAPLAVCGMKASLDEIARGEYALPRLHAREAACAASADLREGLAAFAARRMPRFGGH
ncbi:MAG: enoyl-CoA hydratase [Pseudomonadota bacterium]|nr:enoyl-CoA hydratase/isomerase family protein [Rubrivivax sp.]